MSIRALTTRKPVSPAFKKKASDILRYLIEQISPHEIYLIGSVLRGVVHKNSDLDLVMVVGKNQEAFVRKILPSRPHKGLPLDLHVINLTTFRKFKDVGGISFEATHHGRVLYSERNSFEIRNLFGAKP